MIVVDASVLTAALIDDESSGKAARARLGSDAHWAGPGHLLVDTLQAVRGRLLGRKISAGRAGDAVAALTGASLDVIDVQPLLPRIWELRANVSAYDAAYVAVAEICAVPLITGDARLGRCKVARCTIEVIG